MYRCRWAGKNNIVTLKEIESNEELLAGASQVYEQPHMRYANPPSTLLRDRLNPSLTGVTNPVSYRGE